jgi:tripartite-type tricarboxylate transporter receptor subunit TctC
MVSSTMAPLTPHLKSGTLRGIASFEKERLREFPNIPTFTESGYPVIYDIWYGLLAPKGTPGEVVNTIYTASKKVVENHKGFIEDRLEKMSLLLKFARPEEFNHDLRAENEVMKGVIKDLMRSTK